MRQTFREGGGFEEAAAYSRAVRLGQHVAVSGTAARSGGDAYTQATEALNYIRLLLAAGDTLTDHELHAMRQGEQEIADGDYVRLEELSQTLGT